MRSASRARNSLTPQQVVRERGGLRGLRMSVRRHDGFEIPAGQIENGGTESGDRGSEAQQLAARGHAVQGDGDIVAAARGVHFAGDIVAGGVFQ